MSKYTPFLKTKVNEFGALKSLAAHHKAELIPFFDIPMKKGLTESGLKNAIDTAYKKALGNLKGYSGCYIDTFDIPDSISIAGNDSYQYLINKFSDYKFHPVIGLDRSPNRNSIVFNEKANGNILSNRIAVRIQADDFANYQLVRQDLLNLTAMGKGLFSEWVLILDNRICRGCNVNKRASEISSFINAAITDFPYTTIIVSGSSIPASISEIIAVQKEMTLIRQEVEVFLAVQANNKHLDLYMGDYTVVSPNYSDINFIPEILRNIMAPKIVYSYDNCHYIIRGGALKTHPRGDYQYNDMAKILVAKPFFRGALYSTGDLYISLKAASTSGAKVTASSILNPTINAHMTYMLSIF